MTVGLRPMAVADWIEDGEDFVPQLRERATLLRERNDVIAALPGSQTAQRELLGMVIEHIRCHFPERYTFSNRGGDEHVTVKASGRTFSLSDDHFGESKSAAMRTAAHLVPEDLCLMQANVDDQLRLCAAALCFPTRWRLGEKLGKPLLGIHAPVPGYAPAVGTATDRVMDSLDAARPLWRHNWSLLDSPVLYQPKRVELPQPITPADLADRLWMRSERQTLRRLPQSGAVLFTIRIRQCTLAQLCEQPDAAKRLLLQLQTMPPALRVYKGLEQVNDMLCNYLANR